MGAAKYVAEFPWELRAFIVKEFIQLSELNMDAVDQYNVNLIKKLTHHSLIDASINQPLRLDGELGHDKYSEALVQWRLTV